MTRAKPGRKGIKLAPSRDKLAEPRPRFVSRLGKLEAIRVKLAADLPKPESDRLKLES